MAPFLLRLGPDGVVSRHPLDAAPLTIGRDPGNRIHIGEPRVSRVHAKILGSAGRMELVDNNSTHLSFVNGQSVERSPLAHGDLISIAEDHDFLYLEREDPTRVEQVLAQRKQGKPVAPPPPTGAHIDFVQREMDTIMDMVRQSADDNATVMGIQEQVDRRFADLQALYEISGAINSELDLERLLDLIVTSVVRATGAERGFVLERDASGALAARVARSLRGPLDAVERGQFSSTIASRAIESGRTVWASDMLDDLEAATRSIVDYQIRSAICAPLIARGEVLGVLYVDAKQNLKRFGDRDAAFFMALACQSAIALENARLVDRIRSTIDRLDRKVRELSALYSISESLLASPDQDAMLATILDRSIEVLRAERGSVVLYAQIDSDPPPDDRSPTVPGLRLVRGSGAPGAREQVQIARHGLAEQVSESGNGLIADLDPRDPLWAGLAPKGEVARQVLCVPLKRNQDTIGLMSLVKPRAAPRFADEDMQLMTSIASQAAVTIENSRLYNLAVYDGLTQLHVRRYFEAWLGKEFERARRYGSELSLIILDIDHFKHVNDTYGHQSGDKVLQEVAAVLRAMIRTSDLLARIGGEEFVIGLPQTTLAGAAQFAERLRQAVEAREIVTRDDVLGVTISLGVCSLEVSAPPDRVEFVRFADRALYAAKARGRNRHVVHEPGMGDNPKR